MSWSGSERASGATDYDLLERQVVSLLEDERDFLANAANFAAFVYTELPLVNWAGFYFPDASGLVLGPFGGKPACTRLPMGRGVCGHAFESGAPVVVDDVDAFADHIVCDSASRSELVVPLVVGNAIFGVFDIDSPVKARFTQEDSTGVERLVARFLEYTPLPEEYKTVRNAPPRINERIDVQTCRDHHAVLRYLLDELSASELAPAAASSLLSRIRRVLVMHLKLEDDWLYPRLAGSANTIVRGKAERYRREMGDTRDRFTAFFEKWTANDAISADTEGFRGEWAAFKERLLARIETEDNDLYVAAETDLI